MSRSTFTVFEPDQPRQVVDPEVGRIAQGITAATIAETPRRTGRLAGGWQVHRTAAGRWVVRNTVPYARFVEYGTRHMRAQPAFGRAIASARARYGSR